MAKTAAVLAPKNPYGLAINPKDLVAQTKLDLSTIPDNFISELALAFYEGALKYGRFNWRMAPVKASVYYSAARRHLMKWMSGEERDKKTGTHHMAYAACCVAIIHDARRHGTLIDDRPPRGRINVPVSEELDTVIVGRIKKLQRLFQHESPKQYTILDKVLINDGVTTSARASRRSGGKKSASRTKK